MGKVEIKIPHVTWRDGRPRFIPGKFLRKAGYKGEDLRHGKSGEWFTLAEAIAWSESFQTQLAERREAKAEGRRVPRPKRAAVLTVADLVEQMFDLPTFQPIEDPAERAKREALAPKTIDWYRKMAAAVEAFDPELWLSPAEAVSRLVTKGFRRKVVAAKGLTMARGMVALLRRAFNEIDHVIPANPFAKLKLKTPEPRLNAAEPEWIDTLIAAADAIGRADIGDSVMLGVCTGQRQNDRLALAEKARLDGEIVFRVLKTKVTVIVPALPRLEARLAAAKERHAAYKVAWPNVLLNETGECPWHPSGDHYRQTFADVRAVAIRGIPDIGATQLAREEHARLRLNTEPPTVWKVAPCPELEGFHDQDLRDTAVTWLGRAGCTVPEICAITGHSEQTAYTILKHYLGRHPELARNAMRKVAAWLDAREAVTG